MLFTEFRYSYSQIVTAFLEVGISYLQLLMLGLFPVDIAFYFNV